MNWRLIIITGSMLLLYYVFSFFGKRAWIKFLSKEHKMIFRIDGEVRAAEQLQVMRALRWRIKVACEQNKLILA